MSFVIFFVYLVILIIIFKLGPVQDSSSEIWLGHRVLTVLHGRLGQMFFNPNNVVLVKKKKKQKSMSCNRIFDQVLSGRRVTLTFYFPIFS